MDKVRITVEQNGFCWDFVKEVNPDGTVEIGPGIIPVKEINSWIPTMYPEVKVMKVEIEQKNEKKKP